MAGDCEEVNPTATLLTLSNAGWYERFRQGDNRQNSKREKNARTIAQFNT
jgi:hypothetical protein